MQENRQEKSQIKQKILLYLKNKGISEYKFYKESGVTRGILQQNNGISEDNIARFIAYAPDVSIAWLIAGEGAMLKTKRMFSESPERGEVALYRKDTNFYPVSQAAEPDFSTTRPRIPFDAAAGSLSIVTDSVSEAECERLPVIPIFPAYDFTIFVKGDSMLPDIKSGDELACRFIHEGIAIKWGETYVIDTADGVVVKNLHRGPDNTIICRSLNPRFEDFTVVRSEIYRIARVVGLVRQL